MKRAYVDIPEGQVHYRTEGSGEPILLLHYTPVSSDQYSDVIPLLAREYRVLAMDTLGYGNSDRPPYEYSIEDYARSVISFLDALGIRKTSIVGHHTGAAIAIELAATHPERVNKLVLSGVSLYTPGEREAFLRDRANTPSEIREWHIADDGSYLKEQWDYLRRWSSHLSPEMTFRILVPMLKAGAKLHDGHYAAFRYIKDHKLPLIKCPTLLLIGSGDILYQYHEAVKRLIPNCESRVMEAGNLLGYEKPAEFARSILDFMKSP